MGPPRISSQDVLGPLSVLSPQPWQQRLAKQRALQWQACDTLPQAGSTRTDQKVMGLHRQRLVVIPDASIRAPEVRLYAQQQAA